MDPDMDRGAVPLFHVFGHIAKADSAKFDRSFALANEILRRRQPGSRYIVRRELSRGAKGIVYEVFDQDLRRLSAIKLLNPRICHDRKRQDAFVGEGRITAQLEHPHIVPVHEVGVIGEAGIPFFTMSLTEGEPLSTIILCLAEENRMYEDYYDLHHLLGIFRKVCDAVAYAHSRGIIHRDIKPANIHVGNFGEVLLVDWSLAKYVGQGDDETAESSQVLTLPDEDAFIKTQFGAVKGSLEYLSPEQAYGDESQLDYQTDIFLLGATLYHMFTFFPPYQGRDEREMLGKAERCEFPTPNARRRNGSIPLALEQIILKAMSPLKTHRYRSVPEMCEDIDAFVAGKRACLRRTFSPGEKLIRRKDDTKDSYIILQGKALITRHIEGREIPMAELGRGAIVGEMACLTNQERSADVTALETTHSLLITQEMLLQELEKLPPWLERIVFSLANRVTMLDELMHPLMLRNRPFYLVQALYNCFAGNAITDEDELEIPAFPKNALLQEMHMCTGYDRDTTAKVIDTLIEVGICQCSDELDVSVESLGVFRLFVDFCRYNFRIQGGIREVTGIQLDTELTYYFRQALAAIREATGCTIGEEDAPIEDTQVNRRAVPPTRS